MSGVAKDDPTSTPASDETVAAHEAVEAESSETTSTSEEPRARRVAPHLRVVGEDEEFAPAGGGSDAPPQRIGAVMRATRENLGLTLEQVSKETRVHLSHLRAIEDMTPNLLGAPVYAKGYIRAYARHLGLDEMGTLERYLRECAILKDPEKQEIAPPTTGRKLPMALPVLGFLVLALAGAAGAYFVINNRPAETPPASVAAAREQTPPSSQSILVDNTADAVAANRLHIVAVKPAHLEMRSAAGDKIIDRDFYPGDRPAVPRVGAGWTVSTSDGSAFEWRLGDKSLGLLKPDGGPVLNTSVDQAAQRTPIDPPSAAEAAAPLAAEPAPTPTTTAPARNQPAATPPPQPRPNPPAQRPRQQTPATPPAAAAEQPPAAAAAPPAQAPTTPPRDPALAAYPDQ